MQIVLASNNQHKINELESLLRPLQISLCTVGQFSTTVVEETGKTFVENALLKARHAAACSDLPALADDSGLIVPALNNEPGIFSARYSPQGTDKANRDTLIHNLTAQALHQTPAFFYCCLVLLQNADDPCPIIAEGRWHGMVINEQRGNHGFGYDPCFYLPQLNKTAAELSPAEKNSLSHRAIAMRSLIQQLTCHSR